MRFCGSNIPSGVSRKAARRPGVLLSVLISISVLQPLVCAQVADPVWPRIPAGVEYLQRRIGDVPWAIHVLKFDRSPGSFDFVTALGQGTVSGLASVRRQVDDLPLDRAQAVAAVNGDFFIIRPGPYQGDPTGLHIVDGQLVSTSRGAAFWIDADDSPRIGEVSTRIHITGPEGFAIQAGLNQQCAGNAAVLFTPVFCASTRTSAGSDLVLEAMDRENWLPLRIGRTYTARVVEVRAGGNAALTPHRMVLAVGPDLLDRHPTLAEGTVLEIAVSSSPDLKSVRTAVGGGPILIQDGKLRSWQGNQPRHPRTAVGFNKDAIFLVVVDGRQQGLSAGMTFPELAGLMEEIGCTDAVNLDGGGSSTMWLGGRVMNQPSDGRERPVANSLIVVHKSK